MRAGRRLGNLLAAGVLLHAGALAAVGAGALGATLNARTVVAPPPPQQGGARGRFPHTRHANLFPLCTTCHAGVVAQGQPVWPEPTQCTACHDGVVERRVSWQPRVGPRATNLRFTHDAHARAVLARRPSDSAVARNCTACHNERGAPRMAVRRAVVGQCLGCHRLQGAHFELPGEACATCHVPLTEAASLTREDIARFPRPAAHDAPDFLLGGHGTQAKGPGAPGTPRAVAASCATCHAQNFCVACHVNAPEVPAIRALALDARAPTFEGKVVAPPSHASATFLRTHGRDAQRAAARCATCHTQQSCTSCHVGTTPRAIASLPVPGPGRAAGVHVPRVPPPSHTREFTERHGPEADARPRTCETCHVRDMCLTCHRPDGARQSETTRGTDARQASAGAPRSVGVRRSGFHPPSFITRHPSSAYSRDANCSDCHNPAQFCQSCHQQSGLVALSRIGQRGYHDAFRGFSLGHGQAARQSLESCASCHAERDCTACHSAVGGGFRFSPHGPGFNASRMRAKNPTLCIACHGRAIPGG